jgi:hypothetical protein
MNSLQLEIEMLCIFSGCKKGKKGGIYTTSLFLAVENSFSGMFIHVKDCFTEPLPTKHPSPLPFSLLIARKYTQHLYF